MSKLRVAVITGGHSSERDISLVTAAGVMDHLDKSKYDSVLLDSAKRSDLAKLVSNPPDVAFIAQHGLGDEDGPIQGFLETLQIPYTGSGVLASALAMDKARCKAFLAAHGIPVPQSVTVKKGDPINMAEIPRSAVVVKPNASGSSDGLSIVERDISLELAPALAKAFEFDDTVLIEAFVLGTEITVGVLGNDNPFALPIVEIIPKKGLYDREAKYTQGATQKICPARLSESTTNQAQTIAVRCHTLLGCRGMSRVDMIVAGDDNASVFMIEVNTIPGLTPTSLLPIGAQHVGLSYSNLLDKLIGFATEGNKP